MILVKAQVALSAVFYKGTYKVEQRFGLVRSTRFRLIVAAMSGMRSCDVPAQKTRSSMMVRLVLGVSPSLESIRITLGEVWTYDHACAA